MQMTRVNRLAVTKSRNGTVSATVAATLAVSVILIDTEFVNLVNKISE